MIRSDKLCGLLQVSIYSLNRWQNRHLITPQGRDWEPGQGGYGRALFEYGAIEDFLRAYPNHPQGAESLPALMELLVLSTTLRLPAFITCAQAMEWLGMARAPFRLALDTDLPSIRLGSETGSIRITLTALIDYAQNRQELVTSAFTRGMLGIGQTHLLRLAPSDGSRLLVRQLKRGERGKVFFASNNLLEALNQWVATGTGQEWWDLRVKHSFDPLLTRNQIVTSYPFGARRIDEGIRSGLLPCLNVPEGNSYLSRIPQHAIAHWILTIPLSAGFVGRTFGVSQPTAYRWVTKGKLCNRLHEPCLTRLCLTAYIENNRLSPFDAAAWLKCAEQSRRPVLLRHYPHLLGKLAGSGNANPSATLRGVRLPNGDIVVLRADVEQL